MAAQSNTNSLPETTTATSSTTATGVPDKDFYTWTTFFSILSGSATKTERDGYFDAKDLINEERDCARCNKDREWLLQYSPRRPPPEA